MAVTNIFSGLRSNLMVKDSIAEYLREEIVSGRLKPGEPIVEGKLATKMKVAQTSVREALNILANDGFVQKGSGRSAIVTNLSEEDVRQIHEVRSVLEGLAARILAEKKVEVDDLDQVLADMGAALSCNNIRAFYERDLQFHLLISEKTGNAWLTLDLRRHIVPLFAFVVLRLHGKSRAIEHYQSSLEQHRKMLDAIRSGDAFFAEQQVRRTVLQFQDSTGAVLVSAPQADEPVQS